MYFLNVANWDILKGNVLLSHLDYMYMTYDRLLPGRCDSLDSMVSSAIEVVFY